MNEQQQAALNEASTSVMNLLAASADNLILPHDAAEDLDMGGYNDIINWTDIAHLIYELDPMYL